jgi:hypothetical protein
MENSWEVLIIGVATSPTHSLRQGLDLLVKNFGEFLKENGCIKISTFHLLHKTLLYYFCWREFFNFFLERFFEEV